MLINQITSGVRNISTIEKKLPSSGESIRIRGQVQGVGLQTIVWRLARDCGLRGEVRNEEDDLIVHLWGTLRARQQFVYNLQYKVPPQARIDALERMSLNGKPPAGLFRINEDPQLEQPPESRAGSSAAQHPETRRTREAG